MERQKTGNQNQYFLEGDGISPKVIERDIGLWCSPQASVKPAVRSVSGRSILPCADIFLLDIGLLFHLVFAQGK